jgi:hypothetical protein
VPETEARKATKMPAFHEEHMRRDDLLMRDLLSEVLLFCCAIAVVAAVVAIAVACAQPALG